ncbi:hypothetical protein [Nisaea sp.]|uniref:hypothetical protein n=1 Tax=Nisaea sp. TaxID=2024842 RepID=UPI0032EE67AD
MQTVAVPKAALTRSLFGLRLGVGLVLGMWVLNKFVNPAGTSGVLQHYYGSPEIGVAVSYALGTVQGMIVLAFLIGSRKRVATALVFLMHLASTLAPVANYLDPWTVPNLLFYAAWPMLAAIAALYLLRDYDTLFSMEAGMEAKLDALRPAGD